MKTVQVELPDKVAEEIEQAVEAGWYLNPQELVRTALIEFLDRRRHEVQEQFHREDIEWALTQKKSP